VSNKFLQDDVLERGDAAFWNDMANGNPAFVGSVTSEQGFDAVCDFPCSAFVFDFFESYPDAKVSFLLVEKQILLTLLNVAYIPLLCR
jgi:hypothetical protein